MRTQHTNDLSSASLNMFMEWCQEAAKNIPASRHPIFIGTLEFVLVWLAFADEEAVKSFISDCCYFLAWFIYFPSRYWSLSSAKSIFIRFLKLWTFPFHLQLSIPMKPKYWTAIYLIWVLHNARLSVLENVNLCINCQLCKDFEHDVRKEQLKTRYYTRCEILKWSDVKTAVPISQTAAQLIIWSSHN